MNIACCTLVMHAVKHAQILHVEKKGRTCNNGSVIDHLQQ